MNAYVTLPSYYGKSASFEYRPDVGDIDILRHVYERNGYDLPRDMSGVTFVDVGAHIGGVSVLAAQLGANIIAYEPCAESAQLCGTNLRHNALGPYQVLHNGIGDAGERPLYHSPNNSGQHSEFLIDPYWDAGLTVDRFEVVKFMPLSVATTNLKEFWLKVDCEGSERPLVMELLDGLHAKVPRLFIEFQTPHEHNGQLRFLAELYDITNLGSNEYAMERKT